MVDYLRARHDDGADGWVVQHIQAPDVAERLVERGREIFGTRAGVRLGDRPGHRRPRRARACVGVGGIPLGLLDA